ncbi:hypothetical protein [Viridibacillus arvi]|uniref:hypothetical protein n=1 Tax=Viridibacillus arvi TaxID=263475 RepID=UPI003D030250
MTKPKPLLFAPSMDNFPFTITALSASKIVGSPIIDRDQYSPATFSNRLIYTCTGICACLLLDNENCTVPLGKVAYNACAISL